MYFEGPCTFQYHSVSRHCSWVGSAYVLYCRGPWIKSQLKHVFRCLCKISKKWLLASLCLSVCLSIHTEETSQWKDFHEIWYLSIFQKFVKKLQLWLNSVKNNGYFTWSPVFICDHIRNFFRMQNFQMKVTEKNKTYFFLITFPQKLCHLWVWKSMVEPDRLQMTVQRIHFACWIPNPTDTHSEYVILITLPQQQWLCGFASMLRWYVHCLSCLCISSEPSGSCQCSILNEATEHFLPRPLPFFVP